MLLVHSSHLDIIVNELTFCFLPCSSPKLQYISSNGYYESQTQIV